MIDKFGGGGILHRWILRIEIHPVLFAFPVLLGWLTVAKKLSLVIPVYNKEQFLEDCLQSVANQTISKSLIEVILVDDGSTDGSLAICKRFAETHSFARVIEKPNGGVSSARNAGIRAASGELIAFLDADDGLNDIALEEICKTFERYSDDIDVVVTHLSYRRTDGSVSSHKRYTWLDATGLYDLSKFPYIVQTTMNVAVRNRKDAPILFDEGMVQGEDQLFVTANLLREGKIAYCAEAEYIYLRHPDSASSTGTNPLYCFDDMLKLFQFFLDSAEAQVSVAEYCRQILLYNVDWRLKGNKLFPTYAIEGERAELESRLAGIMAAIPVKSYCRSPYLARQHKIYLLKRYGLIEENSKISISGERATISFPSIGYTWKPNSPRLDFVRFLRRGSCFSITVRLSCPLFVLDGGEIKLAVKIGKSWRNLKLVSSTYDYYWSHEKTGKYYLSSFEVPFKLLDEDSRVSFRCTSSWGKAKHLKVALDSTVGALSTNSSVFNGSWYFRGYEVHSKDKSIIFTKLDKNSKYKRAWDLLTRNRPLFFERIRMKRAIARFKGKDVWVYSDLPTNVSEGSNALVQIIHDLRRNDGVLRYYVCNFKDEIVSCHPELKGKVVEYGSEEHVVLALAASKILASYRERWTFFPEKETIRKFGDYCRDKRIVYLQHGCLHAHLPWYLGWDRCLFDYVVVSSELECNVLVQGYSYPKRSLLKTGAPRTDRLFCESTEKSKKIALIPSWRSYLVGGNGKGRIPIDDRFTSSSFYRGITEFIQLIAAHRVLEEYGYQLDLKLHPNFRCYESHFDLDIPGVNVVFDDIDEREYAIAITDFSSYIYDFIYAGARVMYFLPDEAEFRAGLNHYSELEIPLDDAFGPYSNDAENAVSILSDILRDIESNVPSAYQEKIEGFFFKRDGKARDRLYRALVNMRS